VACALELVDLALERPEQRDYRFLVAEANGTLAGYLCYGPTPMTEGTFDLYWVAAAPELRGTGVGRALLERMEADLQSLSARLVRVEMSSVEADATTQRFYEKNGFLVAARIPGFYKEGDALVILIRRLSG
jgi:ribosomal protein S18 acetylase RimI-like enzyme